jgi:hypothetical protein
VVGEERTLDGLEDLDREATAQMGLYAHPCQDIRTSKKRPGRELLLPLPDWLLSPAPKEELRGKKRHPLLVSARDRGKDEHTAFTTDAGLDTRQGG